jgi:hypothetical protein
MKTTLALLLVVAALTVSAQTNFDVLICKNASYTNATITRTTPAYAVVSYDGGLVRVAMTNLPDALQKQFGYDPVKAAAILDAEKQKRLADIKAQAERQKYIASLRGSNQVIQVQAVVDDYGQCFISSHNGGGGGYSGRQQVYVLGLPQSIADFYTRRTQLKADIANLVAQPISATAKVYGTDDDAFNAQMLLQDTIENARRDKEARLEQMNASLKEMNDAELDATTIIAFPTGTKYSGLPMWQYVGTPDLENNSP